MNILVINLILFTPEKGVIPVVKTIKDTMIHSLCSGFYKTGNKVTLIAAEDYKPGESEKYDFEVKFLTSKYPSVFKPSLIPYPAGLKEFLIGHKDDYDVIISSEAFSLGSLIAASVCPEKLIIWQEMSMHQRKFFKMPSKLWHNLVLRYFMKNVRLIVPRSDFAKNFISKYSKSVGNDIIEHGVDVEKFDYSSHKKRQLISSSQLIYRKNVDGIVRKFKELHDLPGYSDVKLLIAGRGDQESSLKSLVKDLKLSDNVIFLGFLSQKDLNEQIKNSMGFLVNTRQDLNIVSIPESIVSGTPVLTNTVPSSVSYIKNNGLGIVADEWGADELRRLIDDNGRYVENCINYRNKLTNIGVAEKFVEIWNGIQ